MHPFFYGAAIVVCLMTIAVSISLGQEDLAILSGIILVLLVFGKLFNNYEEKIEKRKKYRSRARWGVD